jgi:hypothetical protein
MQGSKFLDFPPFYVYNVDEEERKVLQAIAYFYCESFKSFSKGTGSMQHYCSLDNYVKLWAYFLYMIIVDSNVATVVLN